MTRTSFSLLFAMLLMAGLAYSQDAIRPVQANRITIGVGVDALKDVSFQADRASFEDGAMRLTGHVRITADGHLMTSDVAVIASDRITLEGRASVDQPVAR